jgi:hypothetical protein
MDFFSDETEKAIKKQRRSPVKSPSTVEHTDTCHKRQDFGDATINLVLVAGKQQPRLVLKIADADRKGGFLKQPYEFVDRVGKSMPKASVATKARARLTALSSAHTPTQVAFSQAARVR